MAIASQRKATHSELGTFIELDKVFSLFGTAMYGVFSFYLLACVLKGCMKVAGAEPHTAPPVPAPSPPGARRRMRAPPRRTRR